MTLESKASRLEDPGAQLLDNFASFWSRFGQIVLIALGVVVVVAAGAVFTLRARAASEAQAAGRLAEANIYFWQGDYPRSLQLARETAEQWPSSPSGVDARRLAGDDLFWMGNYKESIAEYRRYLERDKKGILADAVRRSLAYALENDRQFKEAATTFEGLVGTFGRMTSAEFLYDAARCYAQAGQTKDAGRELQRIVDEFGETPYANQARMMQAGLAAAGH